MGSKPSVQGSSMRQQQAARMITDTVKSRQQLEKERDDIIKQTIMQYQKESTEMSERVKNEESMRLKFIQDEKERIKKANEQKEKIRIAQQEKRIRLEAEKKNIEEKKKIADQQAVIQRQQAEQKRREE